MDSSDIGYLLGSLGVFFLLLIIAILIVSIVATWKLFKKAGKSGWESIVPFYSYWVLIEIAGLEWWWFILIIADSVVDFIGLDDLSSLANLVSIFASFNCYYNIAKKFNKTGGTAVCAGIFSFIYVFIFAFSKNEVYNANIPVSKNGVFGTPEMNNNGYNQSSNNVSSTESVDMNQNSVNNFVNQEFSYCGNCGTKINKDVKFCPTCGKENM